MSYLSTNIKHYPAFRQDIVYIIIDRTGTYQSDWTKELIKNLADYTVSDVCSKGYNVLVGLDEDELLNYASQTYQHAVVLSTGTEFINGEGFFNAVNELLKEDFFLVGHLLDRSEGYYELHHQCYVINLEKFKQLGCPEIGQTKLGETHTQFEPHRSDTSIHSDYTPVWIEKGTVLKEYKHKLHGWNILSVGLAAGYTLKVFDANIRTCKKYYYPENQEEFLKHVSWSYMRRNYCETEFVHTDHTETVIIDDYDFEYVITPASGSWFVPYISKTNPVKVIYYDYNQESLNYWKTHAPVIDNVTYEFVKIDLLGQCDYYSILPNTNKKTIINLSNIFCYEATSMFSSVSYRLFKENELLKHIPSNYYVFFNTRSCFAFANVLHYGKQLDTVKINQLCKPTWHINNDWI